ncbi:MAG: TetR/AcrR family transcriptional regulator [Oscillospiraceae bacterium]|nr:TetR/AcrR family transcriptional regulator [Oscillospiraceae bacterium]
MSGHFDTFHSLEPQKKQNIIDAALDEFTGKGFRYASTNAIVENAKISKGTLFYYFASKEELFDFLCDYTIEFAKREYLMKFDTGQTRDFLERYRILSKLKAGLLSSEPKIIKFFESFYLPKNAEYFAKYTEAIGEIRESIEKKLYENLDYSLFRDDIAPEKILVYIGWLLECYAKDLTDTFKKEGGSTGFLQNMADEGFDKFYELLDHMRKMFYKKLL